MFPSLRSATCLLTLALASASLAEEAPAPAPVQKVLGEVTAHDAATSRFTIRKDGGEAAAIALEGATACLKVPPGAKALSEAVPTPCTAIAVGDRLFARGTTMTDGNVLVARQVVVMTKDELAERRSAEREDWRKRGVAGIVKALDPDKKEITLEMRSFAGAREMIVTPAGEATSLRRYAPGSARFADARPCALADLRVGDQLRALGEKSPDGLRLLAEQIVAGAFRTIVGTVDGVHPDERELTLSDVVAAKENGTPTAKRRTLVFNVGARLRRLPPDVAARLAARAARGGPDGARRGPGGPWAGRQEGEPAEGAQRRPGGAASLADMLDRLPELQLGELTAGELVAVAVAEGDSGDTSARAEATTLLAAIEPLLASPDARGNNGGLQTGLAAGSLDLGMGMGMGE